MQTGSLKQYFPDRANPIAPLVEKAHELRGKAKGPMAPLLFGNAGREHMEKYGTKAEHFAKIAEKNHRHLKSLVEVVESLKSVTFPKLVADKGAHRGLHSRAKHVAKEKEVYDDDLARLVFHTDEACSERHLLPNPDTQSGGRDQRKRKHSTDW